MVKRIIIVAGMLLMIPIIAVLYFKDYIIADKKVYNDINSIITKKYKNKEVKSIENDSFYYLLIENHHADFIYKVDEDKYVYINQWNAANKDFKRVIKTLDNDKILATIYIFGIDKKYGVLMNVGRNVGRTL